MRPERGSAGVLACGLVAVAAVLVIGLGRLATGVLAVSRAHTAADAAALAAAARITRAYSAVVWPAVPRIRARSGTGMGGLL